jgi:DNA-binding PucR family transcriptional regulator
MKDFYFKTLGPLNEYDRIHKDSLLDFLSKYISCNCNINETSVELFIHKNTVIYKLKKIDIILNINTNRNEDILDIWTAFLIKDVFGDSL